MNKRSLAELGLWVVYMAIMWGLTLLLTSILDFDFNTVLLYFVAGVVCYLSARDHLRS